MYRFIILLLLILFSCTDDTVSPPPNTDPEEDAYKLYVCDQGADQVAILEASGSNLEVIEYISIDFSEMMEIESPHFIAIDEQNGYWFVSAFMSGFIGRYDLSTDALIDVIDIGDKPALLAVDPTTQTLYVSRMMSMDSMDMDGGLNPELNVIDYSNNLAMVELNRISLTNNQILIFPEPHALSIDTETSVGTILATASITTDWLSKVSLASADPVATSIGFSSGETAPSPDAINELQPIQSTQKDDYIFFSCSGSVSNGVPGQIQSWDVISVTQEDVYEFSSTSVKPWHIIKSPTTNRIYVALKGTSDSNGGVACLSYSDSGELSLEWETTSESYSLIHGVTISSDGSKVYISSSGDGSIHVFDADNGEQMSSISNVAVMMATGIAITQIPR